MSPDTCCWLCRHPTGVCLSRFRCPHHIEARREQDANDSRQRGHRDPTGDTAVNNIMRERKRR